VIGCILKFRETLREALQEVVKEKTPFVWEAVKLAHTQLPDNSQIDPRLMALDYLAQDCGIDVKEADHSLRNALQKYKTTPQDATLWALLPELYGLSFIGLKWQDAHFLIESEGHANNAHTMSSTIHSLISVFERMPLKGEVAANVNEVIQTSLERFVRCASHSILHVTADPTFAAGFPLESVVLFLEQFILGSHGRLQLAMLEESFPFTLLRASHIQLIENQKNRGGEQGPIVTEEQEQKENAPTS
jgi:hypothetical protein